MFTAHVSTDMPGLYEFVVVFQKPAVAAIIDVEFTDVAGSTASMRVSNDDFLRAGKTVIRGNFAKINPDTNVALVNGHIRHVEFADGSVEGDLDPLTVRQQLSGPRAAVRAAAAHYANIARRSGLAGLQKALTADLHAAAKDQSETELNKRLALDLMQFEAKSFELQSLLRRLDQYAR